MATVKKISTELSWQFEKSIARGKSSGFNVTLIQNVDLMARQSSYKTMTVTYDEIVKNQAEALLTYINENKKKLKVLNFKISASYVTFYINEGFKGLNASNLTEALDLLTEGFVHMGINPTSKCIYCGEETLEEVVTNKIAVRAHQVCHSKAEEELKNQKDDEKYGGGVFGALLGAFIISFIYLVLIFIGWIVPLIMIPIGFATYFGYLLLKGPFTSKAKWIVIGVSIGSIVLTLCLTLLMTAFFADMSIVEALQDTELELPYFLGMSGLWGLASTGSAYSLAKRKEF